MSVLANIPPSAPVPDAPAHSLVSAQPVPTPPRLSPEELETLVHNLTQVRMQIEQVAAELNVPLPRLVAVSKFKSVEHIRAAYDAGQRHFGENYVQELMEKAPQLPSDIQWHLIGHLQSNKVNVVEIPNLSYIETIDSIKLVTKLEGAVRRRRAVTSEGQSLTKLNVFVQVLTSDEDRKSGVEPGPELIALCRHIIEQCQSLHLAGLMTIGAPHDPTAFTALRKIREDVASALSIPQETLDLSMGMSADFQEAIRAGSTNVRVGSTIFGARLPKVH